jgi:hypothetical protein
MRGTTQASAPQEGWMSAFTPARVFGGSNGHRTTTEDITLSVALSILIGAAVTIGVAAQRRRKAKNTIQS